MLINCLLKLTLEPEPKFQTLGLQHLHRLDQVNVIEQPNLTVAYEWTHICIERCRSCYASPAPTVPLSFKYCTWSDDPYGWTALSMMSMVYRSVRITRLSSSQAFRRYLHTTPIMSTTLPPTISQGILNIPGATAESKATVERLLEQDRQTHHAMYKNGFHNHLSHQ